MLSSLVIACGDDGGGDSGEGDAAAEVDAAADVDAAPQPDAGEALVRMYVHTATTLYWIDNISFDLIPIGDFDAPFDAVMNDVAVTSDGEIYGVSGDSLYQISRDTAKANLIGEVPGEHNVGLTFLQNGRLLATDKAGGVRSIDPASGDVEEIGAFGGGYATAGDLVAVADGRMFAISDQGPSGDEYDSNRLLTVDTETGSYIEDIGQIGYGGVFGVAVANDHVYAFTSDGHIIEIDPDTGAGTLVRSYDGSDGGQVVSFWGAGVTPRVVIE